MRIRFIMIFASPWGDTWRCEEHIGNILLFTNHDSLTAALEYARQEGYDETNTNIY